jgi:rubrerythrin
MKYEPTRNPFAQNAHDKAQDAIDHAREVREKKIADHRKTVSEPHLIADGNLKRCSVCGYPFEADVKPSMSCAFAEHVLKTHQPGQTSEDVNQAAARIASETTEN